MHRLVSICLAFALVAMPAAASAQLAAPTGVGGCIFLGISREMRLAALGQYVEGGPGAIARTPGLRREIQAPARRCSGGLAIDRNDALLAAFMSSVIKAGSALEVNSHRVGQATLDAAWAQASPEVRAPFVAQAQRFFDGGTRQPIDEAPAIAGFQQPLGLSVPPTGEVRNAMIRYFEGVALNEMAEARLAVR